MKPKFYFVCDRCDAKVFSEHAAVICRCGKEPHSTEKLVPPWEVQKVQDTARRRAEIFLFARGLHPMQEPLLVRALSEYFLRQTTKMASAADA